MQPAILFTSLLLSWNVLLFGGVYPWVFWPTGVGCAVVLSLALTRHGPLELTVLVRCLLLAVVVGLIQLLPLPTYVVELVSPGAGFFLNGDTAFRTPGWAYLSIYPQATAGTLAWVGSLLLLFVALIRAGDTRDFRALAAVVTTLGCLIAVIGLGQHDSSLLYGFWRPLSVNETFSPFVNRNHFAGWMVLAVTAAAGLLGSSIERCPKPADRGRGHVRWRILASPEGCQAMLIVLAMVVMILAILATLSRSGMAAVVVASAVMMAFLVARPGRLLGGAVVGSGVLVAAIAVAILLPWPGTVVARFADAPAAFDSRLTVWRDAIRIFQAFPFAGIGLGAFGLALPHFRTQGPDGFFEAHNDYLQILTEGGIAMGLALGGTAFQFAREVIRRLGRAAPADDYWIRAGAVAGIAGLAAQETVEFSLRSPAVCVMFVIACAAAVHSPGGRRA